ncbi:BZ3500_MvSof-1268-A1-R1_Chr1-3g01608 [Microbotryum saponariae]|uniref:BZ3500_MvSof-1268-A1-R1_Chr1-3g01608 protein n=1 Tax=Microbotryum saponariae TaxID=289078 RepID=A0A2X0KGA4_9BASI|nr:BZ3500_MvSof-1268-A1-R1_Chr1-3g01608 [Microbotryum saponariae]SCZ94129.1 BZ3501_MvSof-1269-A2-R1_Chr1-3g01209 [Microbotryum saponariae]
MEHCFKKGENLYEKKELTDAGYRYALDDQNQLDVPTSNQVQGPGPTPGCGREGQARHDLWPLQKARTRVTR